MIRFLHCLLLLPLTLQAADLPLWQRLPAQIREAVSVVRGSEDLTPTAWQDGARVAVGLSFGVDTEFILTMHPQAIGHRHRMRMLERLIEHMKSRPGVWFATHGQIARFVSGTD